MSGPPVSLRRRLLTGGFWVLVGKVATVVYILTCGVTLLFNYLREPSLVVTVLVYASLVITLVSGIHYVLLTTRLLSESAGS